MTATQEIAARGGTAHKYVVNLCERKQVYETARLVRRDLCVTLRVTTTSRRELGISRSSRRGRRLERVDCSVVDRENCRTRREGEADSQRCRTRADGGAAGRRSGHRGKQCRRRARRAAARDGRRVDRAHLPSERARALLGVASLRFAL